MSNFPGGSGPKHSFDPSARVPTTPTPVPTPQTPAVPVPTVPVTPTASSAAAGVVVPLGQNVEMQFVWIAPGTFRMGSPESERDHREDETEHEVTLTTGFHLAIHQVTQAQWRAVMGQHSFAFSREGPFRERLLRVSDADLDRFPVESVSWDEARQFCTTLGRRFGKQFRLPTEAEWEYACRAGTTTPFSFGHVLNGDRANCDGNYPCGTSDKGPYLQRPAVVGSYAPNPWGLYDMHGNIWEWCNDFYTAEYGSYARTDPTGIVAGDRRVIRGGCWEAVSPYCRSAHRFGEKPETRDQFTGFRVALMF